MLNIIARLETILADLRAKAAGLDAVLNGDPAPATPTIATTSTVAQSAAPVDVTPAPYTPSPALKDAIAEVSAAVDLPFQSAHTTTRVLATVWGDRADEVARNWKQLYYGAACLPEGGIKNAWVSLPAKVPRGTQVWLQQCDGTGNAIGEWVGPLSVEDMGPWFDGTDGHGGHSASYFDPYWETKTRPKAESGRDARGRRTNKAGIDLTPRAMAMVRRRAGQDVDALARSEWEKSGEAYVNVKVIYPGTTPDVPPAPTTVDDDHLTDHFTLHEMERSDTATARGIDNHIPAQLLPNMKDLCQYLLEPLRDWGGPVRINSGYRCDALDKAVHESNGSPQSKDPEHLKAVAADIGAVGIKPLAEVFWYMVDHLEFDRIIWEPAHHHVHVSYHRGANRKQIVTAAPRP